MKKRRTKDTIGKTREGLAEMLTRELGVLVIPEDVWPMQGYWRIQPLDVCVMRWEGIIEFGSFIGDDARTIGSWYTMTECVRHGIEIDKADSDDPAQICAGWHGLQ